MAWLFGYTELFLELQQQRHDSARVVMAVSGGEDRCLASRWSQAHQRQMDKRSKYSIIT